MRHLWPVRLKTYLVVFLALAFAGASTLAWTQWQELTRLRASALAGEDRDGFEARLEQMRQRNDELLAELAALRMAKPGDETGSEGGAAKTAGEGRADPVAVLNRLAEAAVAGLGISKRDEDLELLAAMADLPEFQKMIALQQRGKVEAKYADLFKRLKLTPAELEKLQTLLGDRQGAFADAMMAARGQGLTGRDARELANKVARDTQKEITGSIKELLGPQRFSQLQNYERTAPQREMVSQLADRLSYTTTPLTSRQQDQLVQALANADAQKAARAANAQAKATGQPATRVRPPQTPSIAPLPGTVAGLGLGASSSVAITNTAVNRAQTFLSPQQLAALQRMQQEQQAQQTLGNLLRNGTVTAPTPAPKTPKQPKPKT